LGADVQNVLLIDDDPDIRALVTVFLRTAGIDVKAVEDGFAGLDELHENHYDLVLLDISMPHVNGFKVLKAIRGSKKFSSLPVIMLTARAEKKDLDQVLNHCNDYIIKPPDRKDLLARVDKILSQRPKNEEIQFTNGDFLTDGTLELPIRLVSLSNFGVTFKGLVPLDKGFSLQGLQVGVLKELKVGTSRLKIGDCIPHNTGGYEFFASFENLSPEERQKIYEWICLRAQTRKAG
jgi:CheY-like chemotaxis protein